MAPNLGTNADMLLPSSGNSSSRSVTVTVSAANLNTSSNRLQQQMYKDGEDETIYSCNYDSRSMTSGGGKNSIIKRTIVDMKPIGTNNS